MVDKGSVFEFEKASKPFIFAPFLLETLFKLSFLNKEQISDQESEYMFDVCCETPSDSGKI